MGRYCGIRNCKEGMESIVQPAFDGKCTTSQVLLEMSERKWFNYFRCEFVSEHIASSDRLKLPAGACFELFEPENLIELVAENCRLCVGASSVYVNIELFWEESFACDVEFIPERMCGESLTNRR